MGLNEKTALPEPPPSSDFQSHTWFPMPIDLILSDPWFAGATDAEAWGMVKMMAAAWRQIPAGSLPDDLTNIRHIAHIRDRKGLVMAAIRKPWVLCSDGRLYHPKLSKMVAQSLANGNPKGTKKPPVRRPLGPHIIGSDTIGHDHRLDDDIPF